MREEPGNTPRNYIVDVVLPTDPQEPESGGNWSLAFNDAQEAVDYADSKSETA